MKEKLPILLLHGALGAAEQFNALENLISADFEIYKFDFSAHGSNIYQDSLSIQLFEQDLLNFMDTHALPSISIFGYSMGGYVALSLAAHHPLRIKKVFTLATKFHWNPESANLEIRFLDVKKIKEKVPHFALHLQKLHGDNWENLMIQIADLIIDLGNHPTLTTASLNLIQQQVLLAVGDQDKMVSTKETQDTKDALENAEMLMLRNTPHPWEEVDKMQLAQKIKKFFLQ